MPRRPSRTTIYTALNELEPLEPHFLEATRKLAHWMRERDSDLFRVWHFDGREAEAHVRLEEVDLEDLHPDERDELERQAAERKSDRPPRLSKISAAEAKQIRQGKADEVVLDDRGDLPSRAVPAYGEWWVVEGGDTELIRVVRDPRGRTRILAGGR